MGPFMGKTFLVLVDAYSKWPVVKIMASMSSKAVIVALREIFENGLAFTSTEFQKIMDKNYI